ncbi:MlaD family protein [Hoylesella buccalis]|uniref:Mammalian cell entry protein n=1 Tax=Hoylesella buccalis DNF00853 TaxID=1401074 RepID=A0A096AUX8_9BACT|nr:MlaD family protein [Hoylesella buccalis]KGF34402.1 mammalian cell entry protein [Hoylesella buccalis DNF00853]
MIKVRNEIKIALVAVAGIVALFIGMNFLKGTHLFTGSKTYYFAFDDISGLTKSSPIYASGYQVGLVKDIIFDYSHKNKIKVIAEMDKQMKIPTGTTAFISSDVLGNIKVTLNIAPNKGEFIQEGGLIPGDIDRGPMGEVTSMIPSVKQMLPKLDSILLSLNQLLADPAIASSVHNVQDMTANLTKSSHELNAVVAILNREIPGVVMKTNRILDHSETFTANLSQVDVATTMRKVDEAMADVKAVTAKINSNEGTLGLLMRDPSLYNQLNTTVRSADSLMVNIRQHPKRYVHFSIFGRKDK